MRRFQRILYGGALLAGLALLPTPASAQVSIGINLGGGPPPACPYGYYDYPPYSCAPYGYYGSGYFYNGIFLGVGPWAYWGYHHGWGNYRFRGPGGGYYHGDVYGRNGGYHGGDHYRGNGYHGNDFHGGNYNHGNDYHGGGH